MFGATIRRRVGAVPISCFNRVQFGTLLAGAWGTENSEGAIPRPAVVKEVIQRAK